MPFIGRQAPFETVFSVWLFVPDSCVVQYITMGFKSFMLPNSCQKLTSMRAVRVTKTGKLLKEARKLHRAKGGTAECGDNSLWVHNNQLLSHTHCHFIQCQYKNIYYISFEVRKESQTWSKTNNIHPHQPPPYKVL